jgi:hypothetical protein
MNPFDNQTIPHQHPKTGLSRRQLLWGLGAAGMVGGLGLCGGMSVLA